MICLFACLLVLDWSHVVHLLLKAIYLFWVWTLFHLCVHDLLVVNMTWIGLLMVICTLSFCFVHNNNKTHCCFSSNHSRRWKKTNLPIYPFAAFILHIHTQQQHHHHHQIIVIKANITKAFNDVFIHPWLFWALLVCPSLFFFLSYSRHAQCCHPVRFS